MMPVICSTRFRRVCASDLASDLRGRTMKLQHLVATGILAIATAGAGYYGYSHLLHPPLVTTSFASLAAVSESEIVTASEGKGVSRSPPCARGRWLSTPPAQDY